MLNIDLINNIQGKLTDNINLRNEINYNKTSETKEDFKSFLKKEVKKDVVKEDKSVELNKDFKTPLNSESTEVDGNKDIKETLETSLKKIEEITGDDLESNNIEVEDIIELINLLSNLLVTGDAKTNTEVNVEELVDSNALPEGNLDYIKNLLSEVKVVVNNFEKSNTPNEVFNNFEESNTLNEVFNSFKEIISVNEDNQGIIEGLKSLGNLINSMLEGSKDSTNINLDKVGLNKEILSLLNSISEKDMENLVLPEDKNMVKEIISSLVNIENYNKNLKVKEEPIALEKEKINLKDIIQVKVLPNNLQEESNNSEMGNFFKNNTGEEVNKDIKEEDKILSKFLGEDNKGTFGNILTSYDRFKNNSVEVIQKPEIINSQTLDNDIIKSVKYMMKNNMEELTVKVYPKELGELTIKILSEEGIMKAEIKATSKETLSILNANIAEIKNSLSDQNLKIQEVQVSIYNDDTTFFSGKESSQENQNNKNNSKDRVESIKLNDNEDLITEDIIEGNVNLLV